MSIQSDDDNQEINKKDANFEKLIAPFDSDIKPKASKSKVGKQKKSELIQKSQSQKPEEKSKVSGDSD